MIVAQESALFKAQEQFQRLCQYVETASQGKRIDEVERHLFAEAMQLCRALLEAHVATQGDGDAGPAIDRDKRRCRRLDKRTTRYVSIFGELFIKRWVYAEREGRKTYAPLDERLGLPAGEFSYVLEDWLERMCVKEAFGEACSSLADLLGVRLGVRAAEHMNQAMAEHVEGFYAQHEPAAEQAEMLVSALDSKGVPMRRPVEERVRRGQRRRKGEKANKKKMATVAAVYSIDPFRRDADDVLDEVRRRQQRRDRPRPVDKRVWAEMTCIPEGEKYNGRLLAVVGAAAEMVKRDPQDQKTIVCITDGEKSLIDEINFWFPRRTIHILDIMHVLEYLWSAAYCFHAERSAAAQAFVDHRLRMLLEGKVGRVIGGLRRMATVHRLAGEKRRTLRSVIRYYDNHRDSMRYDEYLAAGYPIGSGVVEGACRHLIKDRMERTGMRWTRPGAQAMLRLRAAYLNNDWQTFVQFRIEAEQTSLYGQHAA